MLQGTIPSSSNLQARNTAKGLDQGLLPQAESMRVLPWVGLWAEEAMAKDLVVRS